MYRLNAGVRGKVYGKDGNGNMKPAPGVTIVMRFSESTIEPSIYTTQTDNEGNYLFDRNLPAYNSYYTILYSLPFTLDGVEYETASAPSVSLIPDVTVNAENLSALVAGSEVVLLTSPYGQTDYDPSANLEIMFSRSVDVSSVDIQLRRNDYYGTSVYFESTWGTNNTALIMNPYSTLRENTRYYILIQGKTIDNTPFDFSGSFVTSGSDQIHMIHTNLEIVEGTYTNNFPVAENIEFIFNTTVDTSGSYIILQENGYPYNSVPCTITLSQDGGTLILNPDEDLMYDFNYYLYYTVYSVSGNYTYDQIYFKTAAQ